MSGMRRIFLFVITAMFVPCLLLGQRTTANISGTVTDSSAGVVPNAKVTATNTGTNVSTTAETNTEGFYVITNLEPGTYSLNVEAVGFQRHEQTGITLQPGQPRTANVSLAVGSTDT